MLPQQTVTDAGGMMGQEAAPACRISWEQGWLGAQGATSWQGEACAPPRVPPCPLRPHGQEIRCLERRWCLVGLQVNFYSTFSMESEAPGALSKPSAARAEQCQQPRLRGSGRGVYWSSSASCPRSCGLASAADSPVAEGCLAADPLLTGGGLGVGWALLQPAGCCESDGAREVFPCSNGRLILPLCSSLTEGSWTAWPGEGRVRSSGFSVAS